MRHLSKVESVPVDFRATSLGVAMCGRPKKASRMEKYCPENDQDPEEWENSSDDNKGRPRKMAKALVFQDECKSANVKTTRNRNCRRKTGESDDECVVNGQMGSVTIGDDDKENRNPRPPPSNGETLNLQGKRFIAREVDGDGYCLFRAVSLLLKGTEDYYSDFRDDAVDYLLQHQEEVEGFVTTSFDKHIANLSRNWWVETIA